MNSFFDNIINHISAKNKNDWSETLLLFPNHRSAYYFREQIKTKLGVGDILPELQTFEDFIFKHSIYQKADVFDLLFSMYDNYKKRYPETTLHHFLSVAKTMLTDFSEIDSELVNPKQFFRDLQALKSMNVYMEEDEEKSFRYKYFWETFQSLYEDLQSICEANKKSYSGFIYKEVAQNVHTISINKTQVYFIGFTQLSKAEKTIAKYLLTQYDGDFLVDIDRFYYEDAEHVAGIPYRKIFKELNIQKPQFISNGIASNEKEIFIVPCNGKHQQIQAAFSLLNAQEIPAEKRPKTALILPDASLLSSLVAALPEQYADANISTGFPMKDALIVRFIKQLFAITQYIKEFNGKRHFHIKLLQQLSNFPFFAKPIFVNKREEKMVYLNAEKAREKFENQDFLFHFLESVTDMQSASEKLETLLAHMDTSRISDNEKLFFNEAAAIISSSKQTTANGTIEDYFLLLIDILKNHSLPFDVDAKKGLQVSGIMESRNLDYEQVLLFSLNEGTFPTSGKGNSYIPYELRMNYLSSPLEKEAISAYLFYRLLHRTSRLYLFYNTNQDAFAGGEPSRFIEQVKLELNRFQNITIKLLEVESEGKPRGEHNIQKTAKTPEIWTKINHHLTEKGLSPSALNTYISCSMQFYYRYILSVKPEEEISETIEANVLGTIVHAILQTLYTPFAGKRITAEDVQKMQDRQRIKSLAKEFLSKEFDTKLLEGKNYLLYKVAQKLAEMFLKNEEAFLRAANEIEIIQLETELKTTLNVREHPVLLKGFADRIDKLNGTLRFADYKTGSTSKISLNEISNETLRNPDNDKKFQLLMYAWLYAQQQPTTEMISGIYWLRNSSDYFDQLTINKKETINQEHLREFESVLLSIIEEIVNEKIPFEMTADEKRCQFCDFKRLCERT